MDAFLNHSNVEWTDYINDSCYKVCWFQRQLNFHSMNFTLYQHLLRHLCTHGALKPRHACRYKPRTDSLSLPPPEGYILFQFVCLTVWLPSVVVVVVKCCCLRIFLVPSDCTLGRVRLWVCNFVTGYPALFIICFHQVSEYELSYSVHNICGK